MPRMRVSYRRDPVTMPGCRQPISHRCANRSAGMWPLRFRPRGFTGNQEQHPVTARNCRLEPAVKPGMGTRQRMAMQVDRTLGRHESAPEATIPVRIERIGGRRGWSGLGNRRKRHPPLHTRRRDRRRNDRHRGLGRRCFRRHRLPHHRRHRGDHARPQRPLFGRDRSRGSHSFSRRRGGPVFPWAAATMQFRAPPCRLLSPARRRPHPRRCRSGCCP